MPCPVGAEVSGVFVNLKEGEVGVGVTEALWRVVAQHWLHSCHWPSGKATAEALGWPLHSLREGG